MQSATATTLLQLAQKAAEVSPDRGYSFLKDGKLSDQASYGHLDQRAREIAFNLSQQGIQPGDRALLVYPAGLEFVRAFWACLYAGVVAVPAPLPHAARWKRTFPRLKAISEDCQAAVTLACSATGASLEHLSPKTLFTDRLQPGSHHWQPPNPKGHDVALLQYTSGSTRQPKGVMLTHANLVHNLEMLAEFHGRQDAMTMVHWLPLYHDMGLIRGMLSPMQMLGNCVMLDAMEFVARPVRWLQALSKHRATVTGAPNFAYALTIRKVKAEQVQGLDLSSLEVAFCSAEPIQSEALRRFAELLQPCGLHAQCLKPAYGLAEATVMVSGHTGDHFASRVVSREALGQKLVREPLHPKDGIELVNCGLPLGAQTVLIVDPQGQICPIDSVGEVWIQGPSVSQGYWGKEGSSPNFQGRLASGEGPFLRTGDLGWMDASGTLTVCGRLKDLVIVRGQNFYPQDIEWALEETVQGLKPGSTAVFSSDDEQVVVVCESLVPSDQLAYAVWAAVGEEFGLSLDAVVTLAPGEIPKTASGKVKRSLTRERYQNRQLPHQHLWRKNHFRA